MRIARVRSPHAGAAGTLVAARGDQWFDITRHDPGHPGPDHGAALSRTLDRNGLARIADLLGDLPASDAVAAPDLTSVASIADPDAAIWGAGLNYRRHQEDLDAEPPRSGPGSYLRPASCLIGNGDAVELPSQSQRVTAEGELGLVVGTRCKNVKRADWRSVVAGVTAVVDMTAEDVIRENPRYIPWAKGFDTFCSVGPVLVTIDEIGDDLTEIQVSTVLNDSVVATSPTSGMMYDIGYLVEHFTAGRTLQPGTVICTGTPGAAVVTEGDRVDSVVAGIGTLSHPVTS